MRLSQTEQKRDSGEFSYNVPLFKKTNANHIALKELHSVCWPATNLKVYRNELHF